MGLPSVTGLRSLSTTSQNMYRRDVATTMTHVGTIVSVPSIPLVDLMVSYI